MTTEPKPEAPEPAPETKPEAPPARARLRLPSLPALRRGGAISGDLDGFAVFECAACEATVDLRDVRDLVAKWQRVLAWIDSLPAYAE